MVTSPFHLLAGLAVLVASVGVGTVVHEFAHAAVLRAVGVPVAVEWLPARSDRSVLRAGATGTWASVRPLALPDGLSPRALRLAAIVPLCMAAPLALVAAGILPDPLRTGDPLFGVALAGWIACAIPSPQDFSLFWHAGDVVADPDEYL